MSRTKIPSHIAIIMDGNGRWAETHGYNRRVGHERGVETVREMVKACGEIGIETLTLFAFSSENWKRPRLEVISLFKLFIVALNKYLDELIENEVKLIFIGDSKSLDVGLRSVIASAQKKTATQKRMILNIALNYGGRWDIANACYNVLKEQPAQLDQKDIENSLDRYFTSHSIGDIDLMIRTGGEHRISNFCLWQSAYAELYFNNKLWPEFNRQDLNDALEWFGGRERRFGSIK